MSVLSSVKELSALINGIEAANVLSEHVALLKTHNDLIQKDVEKLEKENARLVCENRELIEKVKTQTAAANFAEHKGAFFKKLPRGGYGDHPYCPICHSSMLSPGDGRPYVCGNRSCKQQAGFNRRQLGRVLSELQNRDC